MAQVEVHTGSVATVFTATTAGTLLKNQIGKVGQVVVWNVGTGATIDLYDNAVGDSSGTHMWSWATADGKNIYAIQTPFKNGISVVIAGTGAPSCTVVWS